LFLLAKDGCDLEEIFYDLVLFCNRNECSFKKLAENEVSLVLMVTSILNSIAAAVYFDDSQIEQRHKHDAFFDAYSELGMSTGKLLRYVFDFDTSKI